MHPDEQRISSPSSRPDEIRRQVIEMASGRLHDSRDGRADAARLDSGHEGRPSTDPGDRAAMDLYLALLQDRLPIYVRTIVDLGPRAGLGSIQDNLFAVTRATIDFYCEILSAKAAVCARPAQLVRLRQQLRARDLGPAIAYQKVAAYLRKEQELGRLPADVTPVACAHLLLGACVSYAFTDLLMGGDDQPPRDEYARDIVRGLRLGC